MTHLDCAVCGPCETCGPVTVCDRCAGRPPSRCAATDSVIPAPAPSPAGVEPGETSLPGYRVTPKVGTPPDAPAFQQVLTAFRVGSGVQRIRRKRVAGPLIVVNQTLPGAPCS